MPRVIAARPVLCALAFVAGTAATATSLAVAGSLGHDSRFPPGLPFAVLGKEDRTVSVSVYQTPSVDYKRVDRDVCSFPVETHETGIFETLLFRSVKTGKLVRIERGAKLHVTFTNVVTGKSVAGVGYREQRLLPNVSKPTPTTDGFKVYHWQFTGLSLVLSVPQLGPVSLATGVEDVYFKLDRRGRFVSYYGLYQQPPWPPVTFFDPRLCQLLT